MPTALTPDQLRHALALRDLTDPEAGSHAIQMLVDVAVDALAQTWQCDVRRERGPRLVPLGDNYDRSATRLQTSPVTPAIPATSMTATCSAVMPVPWFHQRSPGSPTILPTTSS